MDSTDLTWGLVRAGQVPAFERNNVRIVPLISPDNVPTATLWFAWMRAEAGVSTPVHTHDCETVALLLSGRARCRVGPALTEVVDMEPGDVLYMPAGVVHIEETLGDEPAEFYVARNNHGGGVPNVVAASDAPQH